MTARDLTALLGLALVAAGLTAIDWRLAAITVGTVLFLGAVIGHTRDRTTDTPPEDRP